MTLMTRIPLGLLAAAGADAFVQAHHRPAVLPFIAVAFFDNVYIIQ
jgi:hypothetical protein